VKRILLVLFLIAVVCQVVPAQTVELSKKGGKFQLLRDGKPYSIRGVGGDTQLSELAAAGGNSIRTWSAKGLESLLDKAHKNGLSVCVGMWLGHERHGFDYQNEAAVLKQLNLPFGTRSTISLARSKRSIRSTPR